MVSNVLTKRVSELPLKAKKIFLKAFQTSVKSVGEDKALLVAWKAVKKGYKKINNKWVTKSTSKVQTVKVKGGLFGLSQYVDKVITSDVTDMDDEKVSPELIEKLYINDLIDKTGDIEHYDGEGFPKYKGLFELRKKALKHNKLFGRFYIKRTHPQYKDYIQNYDNKMVGISAEFINPTYNGKTIVDADRIGWSFVINPKNPDSQIAI